MVALKVHQVRFKQQPVSDITAQQDVIYLLRWYFTAINGIHTATPAFSLSFLNVQ